MQACDSLNPNNVEFWVDDIYTPGYDALLRRKEAGLRRAKVCKLLALIAVALAIILIIVIPIVTIRSWAVALWYFAHLLSSETGFSDGRPNQSQIKIQLRYSL